MKRTNILSKLKSQVKLIESLITEGDHWPADYRRKAINRIKLATAGKTPVYTENDIDSDVDKMFTKFTPLSHKNSNLGYFLPIIRMFIDYAGNDKAKRKEFIDVKFNNIVTTLGLISNDPSLEAKFKDDIKQKWSLEDFEKHAAEIQAEIDKADTAQLASVGNANASDYDIIPINSYEELNEKFGGDKTGYKGQYEWCHTNGKSTYNIWTDNGTKQFFVLAKKGWENIQPPDPETTNAFDEYGTSLIAILVKVKNGELLRATLRWNHIIDPSKTVPKASFDDAFLGWGDLSKTVGFNVKAIVEKEIKEQQDEIKNKSERVNKEVSDKLKTITEIDEKTLSKEDKLWLTQVEIPDNVTSIGAKAFLECKNLTTITIPDTVTSIGSSTFYRCHCLKSVTIPNSVTTIEASTFSGCTDLTSVTIPTSVTSIGSYAFHSCKFTSVTIPTSVTSIGHAAFAYCKWLERVMIPNSVTSIGEYTFYECSDLTRVTIGNSVTSIGEMAFYNCGLMSITIPDSVTSIGAEAFDGCRGITNVTFEGKTLDEVKAMTGYPWKIKDPENVITVEAGND